MRPELKYLKKKFQKTIERIFGQEWYKKQYLIAVSGGKDSMALATMAHVIGMKFSVAHCNFNLRPESGDEAQFVKAYFSLLGIVVYRTSFDTQNYAKSKHLSIQEAARELRYDFFNQIIIRKNLDYILTAHHAGDQAETFFINLARGSGPAGLSGIPEQNGNIVRPLLSWTAEEILKWNTLMPIPWMEDSSNAKTNYARNEVRHHVLPLLNQRFAGFSNNVLKSMEIQREYYQYMVKKVETSLEHITQQYMNGSFYNLSAESDLALWPFILRHVLAPLQFSHESIQILHEAILKKKSGIKIESGELVAYSDRDAFILLHSPLGEQKIDFQLEIGTIPLWSGQVKITKHQTYKKSRPDELVLPFSLSGETFTLRNWLPGDRFMIDGKSGKHQKIQNLYTNNKLNYLEKEIHPLLIYHQQIIWIPRLRNAFFATEAQRGESEYFVVQWE